MNKWLNSVAFLLVVGVSVSEAQFSSPPLINPGVRSGTGPNFGPFQGGGFGNPYSNPFGPSSYGGYFGPILGNSGGFQQNGNLGFGSNLAGTGVVSPYGTTGIVTPLSSNITGHPTRFNSYSQYFNNQGTGLLTNVLTTAPPQLNSPAGSNSRLNSGVGSPPQQGPVNPILP